MPGDIYLQIEFADPRRPTARLHYGGIEIRGGKIRVPFASWGSAQLAAAHMVISYSDERPVLHGEVLSDPPAIVGLDDKGDDHDLDTSRLPGSAHASVQAARPGGIVRIRVPENLAVRVG